MTRLHATCVALPTPSGALGVLLLGPSGSGKSDLALRLIDRGAALVADDQVEVWREGGRLFARGPSELAGTLELRGFGLVAVAHLPQVPLGFAVTLTAAAEIERLPEPAWLELEGLALPHLLLDGRSPSATAKLRLAARTRAAAILPPMERGEEAPEATAAGQAAGCAPNAAAALPVVIVTGLSGAGRATALKTLEDLGYEAMDNLPLHLLARAVTEGALRRPVAVGADIRNRDFAAQPFLEQLDLLAQNPSLRLTLLFIDCEEAVLQRRFTETRRRHPLAQDRPLADGIAAERRLMRPLRERADLVIDTSQLSPPDFRRVLSGHLSPASGPGLGIFVTSFSFRRGLPREADFVLDSRFLSNPHYVPELRPLTGREEAVQRFLEEDPAFAPFFEALQRLLAPLFARYEAEGRSYLTIAIGCTGGRHRSVAIAERLSRWLKAEGRRATLLHRDLGLGDTAAGESPSKETLAEEAP